MNPLAKSIDQLNAALNSIYLSDKDSPSKIEYLQENLFDDFLRIFKKLDKKHREQFKRLGSALLHPDAHSEKRSIKAEYTDYFSERFGNKDTLFTLFQNAYLASNKEIYSLKNKAKYYYMLRTRLLSGLENTHFMDIYAKTRVYGGLTVMVLALGTTLIPLVGVTAAGIFTPLANGAIPGADIDKDVPTGDLLTDLINQSLAAPLSVAKYPLGSPEEVTDSTHKMIMAVSYPLRFATSLTLSGITFLGVISLALMGTSLAASEIMLLTLLNVPATVEKQKNLSLKQISWNAKKIPSYIATLLQNTSEGIAAILKSLKGPAKEPPLMLTWNDEDKNLRVELELESVTFERVRADSQEDKESPDSDNTAFENITSVHFIEKGQQRHAASTEHDEPNVAPDAIPTLLSTQGIMLKEDYFQAPEVTEKRQKKYGFKL